MSKNLNSGVENFTYYFGPVLDALRALGGSGSIQEVVGQVAKATNAPEEILEEVLDSGGSRFQNRIQFARLYLAKEGLVSSSKRGVWALTELGTQTRLTHQQARELFKKWSGIFSKERRESTPKDSKAAELVLSEIETSEDVLDHRSGLLNLLKALPPDGFERFCQALLREAGFTDVTVTGRANDGGIDGYGTLEVNALVNFKVLFQCKRYKDSVSPDKIRDFRGAMQGRADKGLFLTTGTFTSESKKEATRDGVPPIELIDGQKLVRLCESLEFGLIPVKAFELSPEFFDKFRSKV